MLRACACLYGLVWFIRLVRSRAGQFGPRIQHFIFVTALLQTTNYVGLTRHEPGFCEPVSNRVSNRWFKPAQMASSIPSPISLIMHASSWLPCTRPHQSLVLSTQDSGVRTGCHCPSLFIPPQKCMYIITYFITKTKTIIPSSF